MTPTPKTLLVYLLHACSSSSTMRFAAAVLAAAFASQPSAQDASADLPPALLREALAAAEDSPTAIEWSAPGGLAEAMDALGAPSTTGSALSATVGGLGLAPAEGLVAVGPTGGPFAPARIAYTLENGSSAPLQWAAYTPAPWAELSRVSGTLAPGAKTTLVAEVSAGANALPSGIHSTQLLVGDLSAGEVTSLPMYLAVLPASQALEVTPPGGIGFSGTTGSPLFPFKKTLRLRNTTGSNMAWGAAGLQFTGVSPTYGFLSPGQEVQLVVRVDPDDFAAVPSGVYRDSVILVDSSGGGSVTSLPVSVSLMAVGSPGTTSSITQHGITWTFDRAYPAGQFANGDWWVVGPIKVVDIDPPSVDAGGRTTNGSMINPSPRNGLAQGYDSAMYDRYAQPGDYDPALNVALGVSAASPLNVPPHSSLVSTKSRATAGLRPQLEAAAVLTVLPQPAAPGSFRPPYCGSNKSIEFHEDQLDTSYLQRLAPVGPTPHLEDVEAWFERPWLDHVPDWPGRYIHPTENMPDYGREMSDQVGNAALMLHLDFTDAEKHTLLVRFVQLGIDFFGIVEDGGENNWPAGGGHHSGRKWPILFAGIVLGDPDMGLIGFDDSIAFNEDDQTFYVEETSPGVFNYGQGGYTSQHEGLAEWGTQHWKQLGRGQLPTLDDEEWFGNSYRTCCTANSWWGSVLAARVMGAQGLWNHDPVFDYLDRYRATAPTTGQAQWTISWSDFPLDMWDAYRGSF